MTTNRTRQSGTAAQVLDVAERLVQCRGFNGFSYADVAGELGISRAALHYHFASKAELGEALLVRYAARFSEALEGLEQRLSDPKAKVAGYVELYMGVLRDGRMCLCGMLAAEFQTLPVNMQRVVKTFLDNNESWLSRVLGEGRSHGTFHFPGSEKERAQMIVASLEGAMLVTRPYGDISRFQAATSTILADLIPQRP